MQRLFKKLARCDRGAATVELALISPILATMLIGVVDVTTAFNQKMELEQAVQRSIERVMQTTGTDTVEDTIKNEIVTAAGAKTGVTANDITVTFNLTCNGTATAWIADCAAGQTEVRYINVEATTQFEPMFPLEKLGLSQSHLTINAETGIRTA